jgi:hypothetical protein
MNPLKTREDFELAALQLLSPLEKKLSPGRARLHLGDTGAVYPDPIAEMEAYSRPLWALVPLMMGGSKQAKPVWDKWMEGLANGTDPNHPEYWGDIGPFDQRMVEMAAMGMALCFVPGPFFFDHPKHVQENIRRWLYQINLYDMPKNNWVFFRVLVNIGFLLNGLQYDEKMLKSDLALIEDHYESDGWYYDYPNQRDYYTHWAFHYYGLLYARAMEKIDPARCETFRQRSRLMEKRFESWFAADGEALPYGRSLSYRFAQSSFFSALALGDPDSKDIDWGVVKGLLLRNMRKWFSRPIFTQEGVLTIGYGYPDLIMGEGYNAPGSPYWAMKAFAALGLPQDHPFWTSEEKQHETPERLLEDHARMLIIRDQSGRHVQAFPAGNRAFEHAHVEAKYEKFAYSTAFAFSVPKGALMLNRGAFDSMLALSDDEAAWHVRHDCGEYSISEDKVESTWHPFADVTVRTTILPLGDWHIRVHRITTPRKLFAAEGGYAVRREEGTTPAQTGIDGLKAFAASGELFSGVAGLRGFTSAQIVTPEPNTNLFYPRTLLPSLRAELPQGETVLVSAVLGAAEDGFQKWQSCPKEAASYADLCK